MGRIEVTPEAAALLSPAEIHRALLRHSRGDWGDVDADTRAENQGGLGYARLSICSRYRSASGAKFWVMTEPERQRTIVMLGSVEESASIY